MIKFERKGEKNTRGALVGKTCRSRARFENHRWNDFKKKFTNAGRNDDDDDDDAKQNKTTFADNAAAAADDEDTLPMKSFKHS